MALSLMRTERPERADTPVSRCCLAACPSDGGLLETFFSSQPHTRSVVRVGGSVVLGQKSPSRKVTSSSSSAAARRASRFEAIMTPVRRLREAGSYQRSLRSSLQKQRALFALLAQVHRNTTDFHPRSHQVSSPPNHSFVHLFFQVRPSVALSQRKHVSATVEA